MEAGMRSYDEYRRLVEARLAGEMTSLGEIPATLLKAMLYSLNAGGKRLRPA